MTIWYRDLSALWSRPFEFFPIRRADQTDSDYVNSLTRFSLYSALAVWLYTRQAVVFAYAGMAILIVTYLYFAKERKEEEARRTNPRAFCRRPTRDNPFANALTDEYDKGEWTPCDGLDDEKKRLESMTRIVDLDDYPNSDMAERQFMTLPNGGYGPDFAGFSRELAKGSGIIG